MRTDVTRSSGSCGDTFVTLSCRLDNVITNLMQSMEGAVHTLHASCIQIQAKRDIYVIYTHYIQQFIYIQFDNDNRFIFYTTGSVLNRCIGVRRPFAVLSLFLSHVLLLMNTYNTVTMIHSLELELEPTAFACYGEVPFQSNHPQAYVFQLEESDPVQISTFNKRGEKKKKRLLKKICHLKK